MMNYELHDMASMWMVGILFMLILAYIISTDAKSNGENGTMWFFIVFFLPMMGVFLYLIIRSNYNNPNLVRGTPPTHESVRAQQPTQGYVTKQNLSEFQFCTNCGFQNTLEASFCKSCGIKLTEGDLI